MKAVVWARYGGAEGLQLQEVDKPSPKENEVLIKVRATTASAGEVALRGLNFPFLLRLPARILIGPRRPARVRILGQELAGDVERVGKEVTRFAAGDPVLAATGLGLGAYAEYKCVVENGAIGLKPANLSYEEAAAVPLGGLEAMRFIRRANVQPGQKVLIVGAGGSIGTFCVQLAKHFGAEVTGVDSTGKLAMLRAIGADHVIDYTLEDFSRNGQIYDFIMDVAGKSSLAQSRRSVRHDSHYLSDRLLTKRTKAAGDGGRRGENLAFLLELLEAGTIKPVIDRCYPLAEAAAAHRYVETGEKRGNVVLTVEHDA
jgi:NADPH:quinone reductase-like Zn-dependent oxidoreductase